MSNAVLGPRDPMPQWYVDDMRDGAQLGDDITVETVYKTTDNLLVRKVVSGQITGIYPYIVCTTSGTWRWIDAAMYRWRHRRKDGQERSRDAGTVDEQVMRALKAKDTSQVALLAALKERRTDD